MATVYVDEDGREVDPRMLHLYEEVEEPKKLSDYINSMVGGAKQLAQIPEESLYSATKEAGGLLSAAEGISRGLTEDSRGLVKEYPEEISGLSAASPSLFHLLTYFSSKNPTNVGPKLAKVADEKLMQSREEFPSEGVTGGIRDFISTQGVPLAAATLIPELAPVAYGASAAGNTLADAAIQDKLSGPGTAAALGGGLVQGGLAVPLGMAMKLPGGLKRGLFETLAMLAQVPIGGAATLASRNIALGEDPEDPIGMLYGQSRESIPGMIAAAGLSSLGRGGLNRLKQPRKPKIDIKAPAETEALLGLPEPEGRLGLPSPDDRFGGTKTRVRKMSEQAAEPFRQTEERLRQAFRPIAAEEARSSTALAFETNNVAQQNQSSSGPIIYAGYEPRPEVPVVMNWDRPADWSFSESGKMLISAPKETVETLSRLPYLGVEYPIADAKALPLETGSKVRIAPGRVFSPRRPPEPGRAPQSRLLLDKDVPILPRNEPQVFNPAEVVPGRAYTPRGGPAGAPEFKSFILDQDVIIKLPSAERAPANIIEAKGVEPNSISIITEKPKITPGRAYTSRAEGLEPGFKPVRIEAPGAAERASHTKMQERMRLAEERLQKTVKEEADYNAASNRPGYIDIINNETGSIDIGGLKDLAVRAWDKARYDYETHGLSSRPGVSRFMWQLKDLEDFGTPGKILPFAQAGKGSFLDKNHILGGVGKTLRKNFSLSITIAENHAPSRPVWEGMTGRLDRAAQIAGDAVFRLRPYFSIPKEQRAKIDQFLLQARKNSSKGFKVTRETLAGAGFSGYEVEGAMAVVDYFRNYTPTEMKKAFAKKFEYLKDISPDEYAQKMAASEEVANRLRALNYVPAWRAKAKYFVSGHNPKTGKRDYVSFVDTMHEVELLSGELSRRGYNVSSGENAIRRRLLPGGDLPNEYLSILGGIDENIPNIKTERDKYGFRGHLEDASLFPGFEGDLGRSIASHVESFAEYVASIEHDGAIDRAIKAIPDDHGEKAYWSKLKTDLHTSDGWVGTAKKYTTAYFLGFNPKSVLVQMTQPITMTYPGLLEYTNPATAMKAMKVGVADAMSYIKDPQGYIKKNPARGKILRSLEQKGKLSAEALRDITMYSQTGLESKTLGGRVFSASMYPFATAEKMNRLQAAIAADSIFDAIPENKRVFGGEVMGREEFINFFVDNTQGNYSKVNLPAIARKNDVTKLAFTFRMYGASWWRSMLRSYDKGNITPLAAQWGTMLALGGLQAAPLGKIAEQAISSITGEPSVRSWIRAMTDEAGVPDFADVLIYGVPSLFGLNFGSSLNVLDPQLDIEQGAAGVANALGGAPLGALGRVARGYQVGKDTKFFPGEFGGGWRGTEMAAPPALASLMSSFRAGRTGEFSSTKGERLAKATPKSLYLRALGFVPPEVATQYELNSGLYNLTRQKSESPLLTNYARALKMGDQEGARKIREEARKRGEVLRPGSVRAQLRALNLDPARAKVKRLGRGEFGRKGRDLLRRYDRSLEE